MKYLLDTHAWVWALDSWPRLPRAVQRVLSDPRNMPMGLSAISVWEFARLVARGKLRLKTPIEHWLARATEPGFVSVLPLTPDIAFRSNQLQPAFSSDPADEIIVATAREHDLTLISADDRIRAYRGVRTLWD